MEKRRSLLNLSFESLAEILNLDPEHEILEGFQDEYDKIRGSISIKISGPQCEIVPELSHPRTEPLEKFQKQGSPVTEEPIEIHKVEIIYKTKESFPEICEHCKGSGWVTVIMTFDLAFGIRESTTKNPMRCPDCAGHGIIFNIPLQLFHALEVWDFSTSIEIHHGSYGQPWEELRE